MWIERAFSPEVLSAAKRFPSLLLTGPRQIGKTSLLRHLFPQASYVTFDYPALAAQAESAPEEFLASLREPAILDEIQYVPSIFRYLKARIDAHRAPGRFLLTGSQTFSLLDKASESLAGRCAFLRMHSLGWSEVSSALPSTTEPEFLIRGGYPELYAENFGEEALWYASYVTAYLERDVRNLKNVGELRDFDRFLRAAALRTGQLLSYSDLARDVGIAPNTAKAWVSVLEASGQIFLLEPYHRSLGKRLVKSPKLYFLDTGLVCHLLGIGSWEDLTRSPLAGALWETHVLGQLVRHFHLRGQRPPLWFWRTQSGDEVDLVIERGARFIAIEAKLAEVPDAASTRGISALAAFYGEKSVESGWIVCRTRSEFVFSKEQKIRATDVLGLIRHLR